MSVNPPPHGMSDVDYEAIEAAVTETVRGRWFLNEFARRNRAAESAPMLEAMARIESMIASQAALPPPADPSVRLLVQRIKDIAGQLETLSRLMREDEVADPFCEAVDLQARAIAGLMRAGGRGPEARTPEVRLVPGKAPGIAAPETRMSDAPPAAGRELAGLGNRVPDGAARGAADERAKPSAPASPDPRLAMFLELEELPLAKKLALFA